MRSVVAFVLCAAVAQLLAGCNISDTQYVREGVGTNLYRSDLPNETDLLNQYVDYICQQGNLSPDGVVLSCNDGNLSSSQWMIFVQTGMNDIDRRCDAYLAWLDNKKRWTGPILQEITDARNATEAIMLGTGVGAVPIAVVGAAFGFGANTFTNVTSRLVLEVNHSTVQSLVLARQNKFRMDLVSDPVTRRSAIFSNRPAAIYALRSYLRICMPFSIEMEINTTLTAVDQGSGNPLYQNESPLTRAASVATATALRQSIPPQGPRGPLPGVGKNPSVPKGETTSDLSIPDAKKNGVEDRMSQDQLGTIQANLCVSTTTRFDNDTREAIRQAKLAARQSAQDLATAPLFDNSVGEIELRLEAQKFADARTCSKDFSGMERGYSTAFEKFRLPGPVAINGLRSRISKCIPNLSLPDSGLFDQPMRSAIMTIKANAPASEKAKFGDPNAGGLNNQSYSYILKACVL